MSFGWKISLAMREPVSGAFAAWDFASGLSIGSRCHGWRRAYASSQGLLGVLCKKYVQ